MKELRSYIRYLILAIGGSFTRPKPGVHILNSHFAARFNPNFEMFCDFLNFLSFYCELVRIEDAVEQIERKKNSTGCLVSFTYDDGFEECHSIIAPGLEKFKINAAFFVNGGFINGNDIYKEDFIRNTVKVRGKSPLSWLQVKDLHNRGHVIGSHTYDHINMNSNDYDFIDVQLSKNKHIIEEYTGNPCEFFAIPFGQLRFINVETLRQVEKYHKYIFSSADYKNYYSFDSRVINRRHIESDWPKSHILYFLSKKKSFNGME